MSLLTLIFITAISSLCSTIIGYLGSTYGKVGRFTGSIVGVFFGFFLCFQLHKLILYISQYVISSSTTTKLREKFINTSFLYDPISILDELRSRNEEIITELIHMIDLLISGSEFEVILYSTLHHFYPEIFEEIEEIEDSKEIRLNTNEISQIKVISYEINELSELLPNLGSAKVLFPTIEVLKNEKLVNRMENAIQISIRSSLRCSSLSKEEHQGMIKLLIAIWKDFPHARSSIRKIASDPQAKNMMEQLNSNFS